jgi:cytochrome b6-f complex iron-sulfur subunit
VTDSLTRRQLVRCAAALGAAPVLGRTLAGCARRIDASRVVATAAPADGVISVPLSSVPELQRAGGAVVLQPAGAGSGLDRAYYPYSVLVVAAHLGPPARYLGFGAACPHAGCYVAWVGADEQIECPCHGSRFASDGSLLSAPAAADLPAVPVEIDAQGNVSVQLLPGDGTYPPLQNGAVTLALADYPALQNEGGVVEGRAAGYPFPIIVVRQGSTFNVLSGVCPHLGCTVLPLTGGFLCPCHRSQFTLSGARLSGPAANGLSDLPFTQPNAGELRITPP